MYDVEMISNQRNRLYLLSWKFNWIATWSDFKVSSKYWLSFVLYVSSIETLKN